MMNRQPTVLIVGAGVFGLTGALTLRRRGYQVSVIDFGPVPHPMAASSDISRMVRMDYGSDWMYSRLAGAAIEGWHRWNARWGQDLYHEAGLLLLSSRPLEEGGYEGDSYRTLTEEGWPLQRLRARALASRFAGWNRDYYIDGYFNPRGGWAEAAAVISRLASEAENSGIAIRTGVAAESVLSKGGRVVGLTTADGETLRADRVVVAAGVWTSTLLPELDGFLRLSGQPILYFRPSDPGLFAADRFPPWGTDLACSGWYGFPATREGIVKIGNHGPGYAVSPDVPRVIPTEDDEISCREFLSHSLPELADVPLHASKMCIYTDTWDGNFLISPHPEVNGLTVATGGSGHGFKFAPVLGGLIADAVEGIPNLYLDRFTWRPVGNLSTEDARYTGK